MEQQTMRDELVGRLGGVGEVLSDESLRYVAGKYKFLLTDDPEKVSQQSRDLAFADCCEIIANGMLNIGQERVQRGNRSKTASGQSLNETTRNELRDRAKAIRAQYGIVVARNVDFKHSRSR